MRKHDPLSVFFSSHKSDFSQIESMSYAVYIKLVSIKIKSDILSPETRCQGEMEVSYGFTVHQTSHQTGRRQRNMRLVIVCLKKKEKSAFEAL